MRSIASRRKVSLAMSVGVLNELSLGFVDMAIFPSGIDADLF
jgi:hypothetical protein